MPQSVAVLGWLITHQRIAAPADSLRPREPKEEEFTLVPAAAGVGTTKAAKESRKSKSEKKAKSAKGPPCTGLNALALIACIEQNTPTGFV